MNENKSEQELQTENPGLETSAAEASEPSLSVEEQLAQANQKLTELQTAIFGLKQRVRTFADVRWKILQKHTNLRSKALQST